MNRIGHAALDLLATVALGVSAGGLAGVAYVAALSFGGAITHGLSAFDPGFFEVGVPYGAVFGALGGAATGLLGGVFRLVLGRGAAGVIGWGVAGGVGGTLSTVVAELPLRSGLDFINPAIIGGRVGLTLGWVLSRGRVR